MHENFSPCRKGWRENFEKALKKGLGDKGWA